MQYYRLTDVIASETDKIELNNYKYAPGYVILNRTQVARTILQAKQNRL
jgi:hypothetical protein